MLSTFLYCMAWRDYFDCNPSDMYCECVEYQAGWQAAMRYHLDLTDQ